MRAARRLILLSCLASAACAERDRAVPIALRGPLGPIASGDASQIAARATKTSAPSRRGAPVAGIARVVSMEEGEVVFGLVRHRGAWTVGTTFTDARKTVLLRPVGRQRLEAAAIETDLGAGFPAALLPGHGDMPWIVHQVGFDQARYKAVRFDGRDRHLALAIPDRHLGAATRVDWQLGSRVRGVAVWQASIVRPLKPREAARAQAEADRNAPPGMIVELSPARTLATAMRYVGQGGRAFEAARWTGERHVPGWVAVAAGPRGWVGAHWERAGRGVAIELHWFDDPSRLRRAVRIAAPASTRDGELLLDGDITYLVADRSIPLQLRRQLVVLAFDGGGALLGQRSIEVPGWVGHAKALFTCGVRSWLVFDAYAPRAGLETLAFLELRPTGRLPEPTIAWTRRTPPQSSNSRPGRGLHAGCGDGRAGVAMTVDEQRADDALVLAEWPVTAPAR
jgi:hypothetical protein